MYTTPTNLTDGWCHNYGRARTAHATPRHPTPPIHTHTCAQSGRSAASFKPRWRWFSARLSLCHRAMLVFPPDLTLPRSVWTPVNLTTGCWLNCKQMVFMICLGTFWIYRVHVFLFMSTSLFFFMKRTWGNKYILCGLCVSIGRLTETVEGIVPCDAATYSFRNMAGVRVQRGPEIGLASWMW